MPSANRRPLLVALVVGSAALGPVAAWAQRAAPAISVSSHGRTVEVDGVLTGCYTVPGSPSLECADQQPVARRRVVIRPRGRIVVDFRDDVTFASSHLETASGTDVGRPLEIVGLSPSRYRLVLPRRLPRTARVLVVAARLPDGNGGAWALNVRRR